MSKFKFNHLSNPHLSFLNTRVSLIYRIHHLLFHIYLHLIWLNCSFSHSSRYVNFLSCTFRCKSWAFPNRPLHHRNNERTLSDDLEQYSPRMALEPRSRSSLANHSDPSLASTTSLVPVYDSLCKHVRIISKYLTSSRYEPCANHPYEQDNEYYQDNRSCYSSGYVGEF